MIGLPPPDAPYKVENNLHNPQDTVSCLRWFSPLSGEYLLGCSSWDSKIRLYTISEQERNLRLTRIVNTESPCLSIAFIPNTSSLVAGCIDNSVKIHDYITNISQTIGHHDDAVKDVYWLGENSLVLSASFDKTLRFWDPRAGNNRPVKQFQVNSKIVCSDCKGPLVALGLQGSQSVVFNYMEARQEILSEQKNYFPSPFDEEQELNCITLFHDLKGFSASSTAGRCDISELIPQFEGLFAKSKIITFKCHKDDHGTANPIKLYPVHSVAFNPTSKYNLITAGGNGKLHFWDYQVKTKTSTIDTKGIPITRAAYSPDGEFMAYASGYDWAAGIEKSMLYKTNVYVHPIKPEDLAKKS